MPPTPSVNLRRPSIVAAGGVGVLLIVGGVFYVRSIADRTSPVAFQEVLRVTSPDGEIDAVLSSAEGGDPDSFAYDVTLVRKGRSPKQGKTVFAADQVEGVDMAWKDPRTLSIKAPRGRVFRQVDRMPTTDPVLAQVRVEYGRR